MRCRSSLPGAIFTQRVDLEMVANVEQSRNHDAPYEPKSTDTCQTTSLGASPGS
jgi:hypothetical protein